MEIKIEADLLLAMIADHQIDVLDAKILDCLVNRCLSRRATARHLRRAESTVRSRLKRLPAIFNKYLSKRHGF